jgi:hypothetical protein
VDARELPLSRKEAHLFIFQVLIATIVVQSLIPSVDAELASLEVSLLVQVA